jgi:acetoin utilization deacetylase AcuC-like enzyme
MATRLVWDENYMWHHSGVFLGAVSDASPIQPSHHPEDPETKRRIKNLLDVSGLTKQLTIIEPRHATEVELGRFHTPAHIEMVRSVSEAGGGNVGRRYVTNIGPGGFEVACLSAGGVISAVDAVLDDEVDNAYALVRPPGHHATAEEAMGFCIFANAAVAGLHALEERGLGRIA